MPNSAFNELVKILSGPAPRRPHDNEPDVDDIPERAKQLVRDHFKHAYPVDTPEPGATLRGERNAPASLVTTRGLARG